jgi:poly(A)-specific ribonuclease
MGDIDNSQFGDAIVNEFRSAMQSCEYAAIDLEMSGISFPNKSASDNGTDTVPFRYHNVREVAAAFGIIQVGIATFNSDNTCRVFNFYVFPRPVTDGDKISSIPNISLCSASTNFNRSNGMDFQRWIDKGITYVDGSLEAALRESILDKDPSVQIEEGWSKFLANLTIDSNIALIPEYISQETKVVEQVENFLANEAETMFRMPFIHGGQKWLKMILNAVHTKYPSLRIIEEISGGGTRRFLTKLNHEQIFNEYIGFRRIWNCLTDSKKPLIVHNGFLDLMFSMQAFESALPETVEQFKQKVRQLFPGGLFDTRLIAMESGIASAGAALETLVELVKSDPAFVNTRVVQSGKYDDGMDEGVQQFHEAGYDALLTGKVFKALRDRVSSDLVGNWKNLVCLARCMWVLTIDNDDTDRVLMDTGPNKCRIIKYLGDFNPKCSTRDVLSSFDDLKSVVTDSLQINIAWINDTSGLLIVTWNQQQNTTLDAVTLTLNSKIMDIIKANVQGNGLLGSSVKLMSVSEFIKKQMVSLEAPKRFRL